VEQVLDGLRLQVGSPIGVITSSKASQTSLKNITIVSSLANEIDPVQPVLLLQRPVIYANPSNLTKIISISLLFCFFFLYCHLCQYPRAILNILFGVVDCLHVITSLKINTPVTNVDKPFLRVNFSLV
jgi:hypothetical protein